MKRNVSSFFIFRITVLFICLMQNTNILAQREGFKKLKKTQDIEIGEECFRVNVDIDIPTKYPALYKRICRDMFGSD